MRLISRFAGIVCVIYCLFRYRPVTPPVAEDFGPDDPGVDVDDFREAL
jgi:hypothetical protein